MSTMRSGAPSWRRALVPAAVAVVLTLTSSPGPVGAAGGPPGHHRKPGSASRLVVHWGDRTPVQGERTVVTGRVLDRPRPSAGPWSVELQVRRGTWQPYLDTRSGPQGRFRFGIRLHERDRPVRFRVVAMPPRGRVAGPSGRRVLHSRTVVFRAVWGARPARAVTYPDAAVVWPAEQVLVGTDQVVSGRVADTVLAGLRGPGGASVSLQRQVLGWWTDVSTSPLVGSAFRTVLPTDHLGHVTYRLVAGGGAEAVDLTGPQDVAVVPPYSPRGRAASYALLSPSVVGRWDPCEPITYRVNVDEAAPGALTDVRAALAQVARATGLRFDYLGTTDVVPFATGTPFDPAVADLVIAWADPREVPGLFAPGVYALGGPEMRSGAFDAAGQRAREIWQAGVVFTSRSNRYLAPGAGPGPTRVGALMHEIGHAVGLAHVDTDRDDRAQIMYPALGPGIDRWGAGDLAGLERIGARDGCLSVGVSPAPLPAPTDPLRAVIERARWRDLPSAPVAEHLP